MNQASLVAAMRSGAPVTPELVNSYYTACIPFYREFLGDHWHTGFYMPGGGIGPQDQLRMERVVADSAGLDPACHVLDVGCGVGGAACHLARVTGASIRGLTPNPAQLQLARESAQRHAVLKVAFDLGEACDLPYPDASFDVVLFFESACHFPDRARFFAESLRVLKPGGRLAGQDWLAGPDQQRSAALVERVCATWAIASLDTVSGYASEMRSAGFDVRLALDMRTEMDLLRGFMATPLQRREVEREACRTANPIRRMIMEGLLVLGEAAECGAFTVGRFLALKPGAS
ncbi:MAG: methyltransferase domain-containing protein [Pseudomonadota bacterium]